VTRSSAQDTIAKTSTKQSPATGSLQVRPIAVGNLKLSINFACLPRETGKARALEIDLRRVEANLSTDEEEKLSNK